MTVHKISIKVNSGYNLISVENYQKLSASERVAMISQKRIQFLDVQGNAIPMMTAVKAINQLKAA